MAPPHLELASTSGRVCCSTSQPCTSRQRSTHISSSHNGYRANQRVARPTRGAPLAAHENGKENGFAQGDGFLWEDVVPSYLHSTRTQDCDDFEAALREADQRSRGEVVTSCETAIWERIRSETQHDAAEEPLLSSFLYASILSHDTFERSLAFVLANRLADVTMLATELFEIFHSILKAEKKVREAAVADLVAVKERDPACITYSAALLYYKGYHALQAYRIAHTLWRRGQKVLALALQSRVSEVFAVDIHPAARVGKGVLLDHGTGVVIGETAVVGNNVSIMQNVTLGGTGKDTGDRHPKISDNVLISAGATVLGNIRVGRGSQVAAGSLVLKPVPTHTMVAGSPAVPVGKVTWNPATNMEHWITAKRDDLVASDVQDAVTMSSPAPPSGNFVAAPRGTPGTLAAEERVLCSGDSDSEYEDEDVDVGKEQAMAQDLQAPNAKALTFEEQVVLPAAGEASAAAGKVAVGAGQQAGGARGKQGKDLLDGVEYMI